MSARRAFLSLSLEEARSELSARGFRPVWADRLRRTLLAGELPVEAAKPGAALPRALLPQLEADYSWLSLQETAQSRAEDGAVKHLLELADGEAVEAVRLPGSGANDCSA